jgi:hypothetical protein
MDFDTKSVTPRIVSKQWQEKSSLAGPQKLQLSGHIETNM